MTGTAARSGSDRHLLGRVDSGDQAAFASLFDEYVGSVYRFAARRLGSPADAEDLTSIVFMTAWRRREDLRTFKGSPIAWLLVTADRSANNLVRARRREAALVDRLARTRDVAAVVDAAPQFPDVLPDGLRNSLDKLGRADREVLNLAIVAELSYEEIANALGVPVGTVRSRLSRAKARLRSVMSRSTGNPSTAEGVQ